MNFEKVLKEYNGILEGHFLLASGLHASRYIQCAKILQYPGIVETAALALIKKIKDNNIDISTIDVVFSPALGGVIIGYEIARQLKKARFIFAEKEENTLRLRRDFLIKEKEKVMIVEDVVTTGKSVGQLIDIIRTNQAELVCISALVDRRWKQDSPVIINLVNLSSEINITNNRDNPWGVFTPRNCFLCQAGLPITRPGTK